MRKRLRIRSINNKDQAQGIVEFALVLPILLMLVFGIVELGRLLFIYSAVATASREAARYGSAAGDTPGGTPRYMDCAGMQDAAMRLGSIAGVQSSDVTIQYDSGPSTSVFDTCPAGSADDITGGTDRVVVSVSTDFTPILPIVNLPAFPITSQSARTVIKNIQVFGNTATSGPGATATNTSAAPPPTATNTGVAPTATNTSVAPTATNTGVPAPTETNTSVPTATFTDAPTPLAPVFDSVNWTPNGDWTTNPGSSPIHYQVYKNGSSQGIVAAGDPGATTWNTSTSLTNNGTVTLSSQGVFLGPVGSEILSKTYLCDKGNLQEQ